MSHDDKQGQLDWPLVACYLGLDKSQGRQVVAGLLFQPVAWGKWQLDTLGRWEDAENALDRMDCKIKALPDQEDGVELQEDPDYYARSWRGLFSNLSLHLHRVCRGQPTCRPEDECQYQVKNENYTI